MNLKARQHEVMEWSLTGSGQCDNPYADIDVDVIIRGDSGEWRVPAFWSGGMEWRVRFAPPVPGAYKWRSECSDSEQAGLHGVEGTLEAAPYTGDNPILKHGPLQIADNKRHLRHADGTPFFWLGDTWWMGFTKRLSWPEGFEELAEDRLRKGFTLIQMVAGIYPDMPFGDPRGESEAGLPYDEKLDRANPAWWDLADLKVRCLVRKGLTPCIVGCWGYYASIFGTEKMKRHWRHIIARWGAYPVLWCLAGEATMPYYREGDWERDPDKQRKQWTEIARYVHEIDPMQRPVTIHPTHSGREQVEDDKVLDFDMLQTGHDGRVAIKNSVTRIRESLAKTPDMPVVIGEVIYEGIMHDSDAEKERLVWWASMLSGAAGFTYGANGIWQLNEPGNPYGPSPHGGNWGNTPWNEAAQLPGSTHLGLSARFMQRFDWQKMEAHPEWIEPQVEEDDFYNYYAAGVPGEYRLIYFYALILPWRKERPVVTSLEKGKQYSAFWFDPRTGIKTEIGLIEGDKDGKWEVPLTPELKDYVLALHAK